MILYGVRGLLATTPDGVFWGKGDDKKEAKTAANTARDTNTANMNAGIAESTSRVNTLTGRSDQERQTLTDRYNQGKSSGDYLGAISSAQSAPSGSAASDSSGGGGGGGGSDGGGGGTSYESVWDELMNKIGGFDPTRLKNIEESSGKLRGAEGNYGASKAAIGSLQDYAKTGGITDADRAAVNRDTLTEFERTGGYSDADRANIRSRSNSAVPAMYQNLKEGMDRSRMAGNFGGPGVDRAAFKLARQGAQDQAGAARDTEIGISDAVRQGKFDASKFLSQQGMGLAELTSRNTLQGYQSAGGLDVDRNRAIQDALSQGANIDLGTQGTINQARLGASTSSAQDARARQAIGASSGAAAAARADANARWASEMEQRDREFGSSGLNDLYSARPEELIYNQGQLADYRSGQMQGGQNDVSNRINIGHMPGVMDSIGKGLGIAGQIGGIGGAIVGGYRGATGGGNRPVAGGYLPNGGLVG